MYSNKSDLNRFQSKQEMNQKVIILLWVQLVVVWMLLQSKSRMRIVWNRWFRRRKVVNLKVGVRFDSILLRRNRLFSILLALFSSVEATSKMMMRKKKKTKREVENNNNYLRVSKSMPRRSRVVKVAKRMKSKSKTKGKRISEWFLWWIPLGLKRVIGCKLKENETEKGKMKKEMKSIS